MCVRLETTREHGTVVLFYCVASLAIAQTSDCLGPFQLLAFVTILTGSDQIHLKLVRDSHHRQTPSISVCICGVMWQIRGAKRMQLLDVWW